MQGAEHGLHPFEHALGVELGHFAAQLVQAGLQRLKLNGLGALVVGVVLLLLGGFVGCRRLGRVALAVELANAGHPLVLVLDFRAVNHQVQHVHDHLGGVGGNLAQQLHHLLHGSLGVGFAVVALPDDVVTLAVGDVVERGAVLLALVDRHPFNRLAFAHDANHLLLGHELLDVREAQPPGQLLGQAQVIGQFAGGE